MPFCPKCGGSVEGQQAFCARCGGPLPSQAQPMPAMPPPGHQPTSTSSYESFAETVGMVPSINVKDNLIQGAVVGIGTLLSAGAGYFVSGRFEGAMVGALGGLILSGLLSGGVLMVLGWTRAAARKKGP